MRMGQHGDIRIWAGEYRDRGIQGWGNMGTEEYEMRQYGKGGCGDGAI